MDVLVSVLLCLQDFLEPSKSSTLVVSLNKLHFCSFENDRQDSQTLSWCFHKPLFQSILSFAVPLKSTESDSNCAGITARGVYVSMSFIFAALCDCPHFLFSLQPSAFKVFGLVIKGIDWEWYCAYPPILPLNSRCACWILILWKGKSWEIKL